MTICAICQVQESKYKCPTCAIPYCSLSCYKPHKAAHSTDPPPPPPAPALPSQLPPIVQPSPSSEKADPLATLLTSPAIKHLLESPTLCTHLLNVYAATEPRGGEGGRWTEELGNKAAADELRRLRDGGNVEIEEFVEAVVGMLDQGGGA